MFNEFPDILTVEEACEALLIGRNNLYKILADKSLKAYKNGRLWRIPKQALIEYVQTNSSLQ